MAKVDSKSNVPVLHGPDSPEVEVRSLRGELKQALQARCKALGIDFGKMNVSIEHQPPRVDWQSKGQKRSVPLDPQLLEKDVQHRELKIANLANLILGITRGTRQPVELPAVESADKFETSARRTEAKREEPKALKPPRAKKLTTEQTDQKYFAQNKDALRALRPDVDGMSAKRAGLLVSQVERQLKTLGFYDGPIDHIAGDGVTSGISRFVEASRRAGVQEPEMARFLEYMASEQQARGGFIDVAKFGELAVQGGFVARREPPRPDRFDRQQPPVKEPPQPDLQAQIKQALAEANRPKPLTKEAFRSLEHIDPQQTAERLLATPEEERAELLPHLRNRLLGAEPGQGERAGALLGHILKNLDKLPARERPEIERFAASLMQAAVESKEMKYFDRDDFVLAFLDNGGEQYLMGMEVRPGDKRKSGERFTPELMKAMSNELRSGSFSSKEGMRADAVEDVIIRHKLSPQMTSTLLDVANQGAAPRYGAMSSEGNQLQIDLQQQINTVADGLRQTLDRDGRNRLAAYAERAKAAPEDKKAREEFVSYVAQQLQAANAGKGAVSPDAIRNVAARFATSLATR